MARNFASASSQYLQLAAAPVTAAPFSMACWFKPVSAAVTYNLINIGNADGANYFTIYANPTGSSAVIGAAAGSGGPENLAVSSTTFSAGAWSHAATVFTSASSRAAFLNGGGKGTDANSRTPVSVAQTNIGVYNAGGLWGLFNGPIADAAIWNVALTDDEVLALAKGLATPLEIRRSALVAYWPLLGGTLADYSGNGRLMVATGATATNDGPPVAMPFAMPARLFRPSAGGTISDADGSAAGTGTAAGVGAALAPTVATAAGSSTVAAVGARLAASVATASGVGTAAAIGLALAPSVATAAGSSTVAGVGTSISVGAGVGTAVGTATATAVGASLAASIASAAGVGTVAGVGTSLAASVATTSGVGTASGVGLALAPSVATAAGTGTASAVGARLAASVATASGSATVSGVGTTAGAVTTSYPAAALIFGC